MEAIKAKDVRYTKSYQSRCSVCKQNLLRENDRKENLSDLSLFLQLYKKKE